LRLQFVTCGAIFSACAWVDIVRKTISSDIKMNRIFKSADKAEAESTAPRGD